MMNAMISCRAGIAVLVDNDQYTSIDIESGLDPTPRSIGEIRFLLGDTTDIEYIEDTDLDMARATLTRAVNNAESLHLALICVDSTLKMSTREHAIAALNTMLADRICWSYVERILYARPLPPVADLAGMVVMARNTRNTLVEIFFSCMMNYQEIIRQAWYSYNLLVPIFMPDPEKRSEFLEHLLRNGVFTLVVYRADGIILSALRTDVISLSKDFAELVGFPAFLDHWISEVQAAITAPTTQETMAFEDWGVPSTASGQSHVPARQPDTQTPPPTTKPETESMPRRVSYDTEIAGYTVTIYYMRSGINQLGGRNPHKWQVWATCPVSGKKFAQTSDSVDEATRAVAGDVLNSIIKSEVQSAMEANTLTASAARLDYSRIGGAAGSATTILKDTHKSGLGTNHASTRRP